MTNIREITLGRWARGEKSGVWTTIPEMNDEDLLLYIHATKAQIKLRQRALIAAEDEAQKRGLMAEKGCNE